MKTSHEHLERFFLDHIQPAIEAGRVLPELEREYVKNFYIKPRPVFEDRCFGKKYVFEEESWNGERYHAWEVEKRGSEYELLHPEEKDGDAGLRYVCLSDAEKLMCPGDYKLFCDLLKIWAETDNLEDALDMAECDIRDAEGRELMRFA